MRAPKFWQTGGNRLAAIALSPASMLYRFGALASQIGVSPFTPDVPVICIGNLVAGGAGKTPTAMAVTRWFQDHRHRPHILLRGYGGSLSRSGPHQVDPAQHSVTEVGDEALLHARVAPTFISANRVAGAKAAAERSNVIVMDDGFQNPTLEKALSILVFDAEYGIGNGRVLPAGPLREPLTAGLKRADAIVVIGRGHVTSKLRHADLPILRAQLVPDASSNDLKGRSVYAYSGIGNPRKFERTLMELGCNVVGFQSFPDHHNFTDAELDHVMKLASQLDAVPVTTEKDLVRIEPDRRDQVRAISVRLTFERPEQLDQLLSPVLTASTDATIAEISAQPISVVTTASVPPAAQDQDAP